MLIMKVLFYIERNKGSEVLKYWELSPALLSKEIRIGAIEIWVLKNFWPFIYIMNNLVEP